MATPARRSFDLPGSPGPLRGEILAAGGIRPAVVVCGTPAPAGLVERLARAGFAVVQPADAARLAAVLAALAEGRLGPVPPAVGLFGRAAAAVVGAAAAAGPAVRTIVTSGGPAPGSATAPWLHLAADTPDERLEAEALGWFVRHLA